MVWWGVNKNMKIGKFNVKEIQKYADENELSSINSTMLSILTTMVNEYLKAIEKEGVLIEYQSREGDKRIKKNQLVDNVIPTFSMISKILKDNNLVLGKKVVDEEADEFQTIMNKLIEKR